MIAINILFLFNVRCTGQSEYVVENERKRM